jgi:hypothetical protein
MQLSEDAFKTKGSVEASVAKEPRRETVAKSDVKESSGGWPARATHLRESGTRFGLALRSPASWK